ncbi:hypothetical protein CTAYLR_009400 [Chrysophaeum taylorii]|uniref:AB hydrolase-1 domain-containing protein n=1 Tax=Chrysophaeum taylorii TaxID=2483200 RepID=A0AAD7UJQ7_9STRA|nr:hypothetical protein CTAYLR_009400 [Chrysophaeum taylorii]
MGRRTWIARLRGLVLMVVYDAAREWLWQMIWRSRRPRRRDQIVRCEDGGEMALHHLYEEEGEGVGVLILHGLTGDGVDSFAHELARGIRSLGFGRVATSSRRGCGELRFGSTSISHAAAEADVAALVDAFDCRSLVVVAASFGGLLALRYAANPSPKVCAVFCVCPIVSPARNERYVAQMPFGRRIDAAVAQRLVSQFNRARYPAVLPKVDRVRDFDGVVTVAAAGFSSVDAYYAAAEASNVEVRVPTMLCNAADDPVVDPAALPSSTGQLRVHLTPSGSHCGDPRGILAQLVVSLRGGTGSYHARALAAFLADVL